MGQHPTYGAVHLQVDTLEVDLDTFGCWMTLVWVGVGGKWSVMKFDLVWVCYLSIMLIFREFYSVEKKRDVSSRGPYMEPQIERCDVKPEFSYFFIFSYIIYIVFCCENCVNILHRYVSSKICSKIKYLRDFLSIFFSILRRQKYPM